MKKALILLMMLCVSLSLFAGGEAESSETGGGTESSETESDEGFTFGVSFKSLLQPRWEFDIAAMKAEAERLGDTVLIQNADDDSGKQASQVENLLSQGIDCLLISPTDYVATSAIIDSVREAGIPVIAYDEPIDGADVNYIVIRDTKTATEGQALGAVEFAPPNADDPPKYALIKGDGRQSNALLFEDYWHNILDPYIEKGEIEIVVDQYHQNWSGERAMMTAENTLTAHDDDVDAFIVMNDGMAVGVSQAVMARGLEGKVYISGLDADVANLRLIANGVQTLTYWTRIDEMGRRAIAAAHDLASGKKPPSDGTEDMGRGPVPAGFISVDRVEKSNLCEFITEIAPEGWVEAEDVFVDQPIPDDCK